MKYLKYLFLFTIVASFASCFPDNDKLFDGPTVLEFKPILRTVKVTAAAGAANGLIQLVGPQRSEAITIPYSVDPASTAVAGTHYTLAPGGTITIAPNTSSISLPITITPGSVTATAGVRLIINLGDASGDIKPNPNFSKYTLTIVP